MTRTDQLQLVDRVESLAIKVYCEAVGLDTTLYPLISDPDVTTVEELERRETAIMDWFRTDPPRHLTSFIRACKRPDICLELTGVYLDKNEKMTRSIRICGVRQDDDGFLAVQDSTTTETKDVAIYQLDAVRLADAMLKFTPDAKAGTCGELVTREPTQTVSRAHTSVLDSDDGGYESRLQRYREEPVTFSAFVQIHAFRPRDWGYDDRYLHVHWEHKDGDGQYILYRSDGERVVPADRKRLTREINACVAKTVRQIRERRANVE